MQCEAKSKQSGNQCKRHAAPGKSVCVMHGGKSLVGVASPQFRSGKFSKYIPERLLERYQEAQDDPDLLALRQEVALIDARLLDLLGRVDTGESGTLWRKAQELLIEFREASDEKDGIEQQRCLAELEQTIGDGVSDYTAWDEVYRAITQRQKLTESERKRLVELKQVITNERAMVLIANLSDIIRRHVTDRDTLSAIATDLVRLVGHNPSGVVDL